MLSRDFSKSNKEYFKKNKYVLCIVLALLVIGVIVACVFGFNGNFELKGYTEFSVEVGQVSNKKSNEFRQDIKTIVNSYGADFDTISILNDGDLTTYIVRYTNDISSAKQIKINEKISNELGIEIAAITEHVFVEPVVESLDYVYTAVAILIIYVIATLFAYFRYNGASSIALLSACVLGTLGMLAISAILRLSIGMSYFAMLVILNLLIIYNALNMFENIKESNLLESNDYENAIKTSLKKSRLRLSLLSIAIMVIGVLFVLLAPDTARFISLNIMFMAVVLLAVSCYVIPFMWSVFITHSNKRKVKKEQK